MSEKSFEKLINSDNESKKLKAIQKFKKTFVWNFEEYITNPENHARISPSVEKMLSNVKQEELIPHDLDIEYIFDKTFTQLVINKRDPGSNFANITEDEKQMHQELRNLIFSNPPKPTYPEVNR